MYGSTCFIANQAKTYFFEAVADKLISVGVNVSWISVSRSLTEYLSDKYGAERVLHIDLFSRGQAIKDFTLNELVASDRSLSVQRERAYLYLEGIQRPTYDFVKDNKIKFIFGELTWAHELLILRMTKGCEELGCKYLNPHTVRIPQGYFGFFTDEYQSELHGVKGERDDFRLEVVKPEYLALNNSLIERHFSIKARVNRLKNFILAVHDERGNPTKFQSRLRKFTDHAVRELRKESYRYVRLKYLSSEYSGEYVLYPLHKQPEASVDVIGRYYEDQYCNIFNIWRALPSGWSVLVKEHSNALGDRGVLFYNRLRKLKGVVLVSERLDNYELIRSAKAVFTVSGTAAYESALMGVPSLTFAPCFFNKLNMCNQVTLDDLRDIGIQTLVENAHASKKDLSDYKAWLFDKIFKGLISDPLSNIQSISDENIDLVYKAFLLVIKESEL